MSVATFAFSPADFASIAKLVLERSAIVLDENKAYLIESRLAPVARKHGLDTIGDLVSKFSGPASQQVKDDVIDAMTTNETSFYRDVYPFDLLKSKIIPELIENRTKEKRLTIWSNACSTGQEAYSIAMLIREHFPELAKWDIRIRGTDLSTQVVERARLGIFNQSEVNRGLPMQLLMKYFRREGVHWQISEAIREMVKFENFNLIDRWPLSFREIDVVFLRNVLIYFTPQTKSEILSKVRERICSDGYLFLGGSESTLNLTTNFRRVQIARSVYYEPV